MHGDGGGVRYPGLVGGSCPFWGIRYHMCMHFMIACEAEKRRGPGGSWKEERGKGGEGRAVTFMIDYEAHHMSHDERECRGIFIFIFVLFVLCRLASSIIISSS